MLPAVVLTLLPWTGPSLPTVSAEAAKYRLTVSGAPLQEVRLQATGLPNGWVASFCTQTFCSPYHYTLKLDAKGRGEIEFQAIRLEPKTAKRARLLVIANGGARAEATPVFR